MMHCCISGNLYDFHTNNVCEVTIAKLGHIFGIEPMAHCRKRLHLQCYECYELGVGGDTVYDHPLIAKGVAKAKGIQTLGGSRFNMYC